MRVLIQFTIPHEPFNTLVREGVVGQKIGRILETLKPEAAYFTEYEGHRGGMFVVDIKNPSDLPRVCEPLFLTFNADVRTKVCMTPEDLGAAKLDKLGRDWS